MKQVRGFFGLIVLSFGFWMPIWSAFSDVQRKDDFKLGLEMLLKRLNQEKSFYQWSEKIETHFDWVVQGRDERVKNFFKNNNIWNATKEFLSNFEYRYLVETLKSKSYTMDDLLNLTYVFKDKKYKLFPTIKIKKYVLKNIQDFFTIPKGDKVGLLVTNKIAQKMKEVEDAGDTVSDAGDTVSKELVEAIDKVFFEEIETPKHYKMYQKDVKWSLLQKVNEIKEKMWGITVSAMLAKNLLESPVGDYSPVKSYAQVYWSTEVTQFNVQDKVNDNKKRFEILQKIVDDYSVSGIKFMEYVPAFAYAFLEYFCVGSNERKAPLLRGDWWRLEVEKKETPKNTSSLEEAFEKENLAKAEEIKERYKGLSVKWVLIDQDKQKKEQEDKKFIAEKLKEGKDYTPKIANPVMDEEKKKQIKLAAEQVEVQQQQKVLSQAEHERLKKNSWVNRLWSWFGY